MWLPRGWSKLSARAEPGPAAALARARAAPGGQKRYLRARPRGFAALVGTEVACAIPPKYYGYLCASCYDIVRVRGSWGEVMEEETWHARAAWGL